MKKTINTPTTTIFDADEFADAMRNHCLCIAFDNLLLSGPEGSFLSKGTLISRGDKLQLEVSPIPADGSSVPPSSKKGYSITYGPSDAWLATGTTFHELNLSFPNLRPPYTDCSVHNGHVCYEIEVRKIVLYHKPPSEEAQAELIKTFQWIRELQRSKGVDTSAEPEPKNSAHLRAYLANTTLKLFNSGIKTTSLHPHFSHPSESHSTDSFKGELEHWDYCFTQKGSDVTIYLDSKDNFSSPSKEYDRSVLSALLAAFGFVHGIVAIPWRISHRRDDCHDSNEFTAEFSAAEKGPMPIGGSRNYDFNNSNGLGHRIIRTLVDHICSQSDTAKIMSSYHWQHVEAAKGSTVTLYQCLHTCAILEGIANQLLVKKFNWTPVKCKKATAINRMKAAVSSLGLKWDNGFDAVYGEWSKLRNSLAHGDFFGPTGASGQDLFSLTHQVSGGIMALILADAGWTEPINFSTIKQTSYLYY